VDADDIQLVEMLANLAEENDTTTNVDDDSVLGSQYSIFSEVAKDDPEEEEVEDLNITSLDLNNLNWVSMCKESDKCDDIENICKQNTESANSSNIVEENYENTFTDFPQFDGIDNSYENILKYGKISTNRLINKNNNTKKYSITVFSKNTQHVVRVINTTRNRAICNFYKNLCLMDVIKYFNINNPNQYHLKNELYNFLNRYYFHIFIKTDKNLRNIYTNNLYSGKNTIIKKIYLKDKEGNILNKKTKKSLYITCYQIQLDHQDLDVYDIDDVKTFGTIDDLNQYNTTYIHYEKNKYNCIQDAKLYFQRRALLNSNCCHKSCISSKFIISSTDGATNTDSSDSELETDITINKQEKRICVYKSGKKDIQSMVQITPKKRKLDFEESPNKRKNTTIQTPRKQYSSPNKIHRSPRLSGNYSPLNITITSPKASKSPLRKYESVKEKHVMMSDTPSTSTTPNHKRHPLHISLFREKRGRNLLNLNIGK